MKTVSLGSVVKVHLTGKLGNGEVFDSTAGGEPVELRTGAGLLLRGFEEAILGMEDGQKKTFTLPAVAAYGLRDDTLEKTLSRADLPADYDPVPGDILVADPAEGLERPVRVKQVDAANILVDLNHPLAGEDLTYEVEIISIA